MATAGRETARVGDIVGGRYELRGQLGRGGLAVVYEAVDTSTGERIALKRLQLPKSISRARHVGQLFEREYHTLCQLAHPRIVSVRDYAIDDQGQYYTMELLSGGDLRQLAPLDPIRACSVARDVCSALSLLHSRRFVHCDVTTRNVRCTGDGLAKLIDFGAMVPMGPTRYIVGTPAFCAPEVLERQHLDGRADLFSLGATLYYALTGRHAYQVRRFSSLHEAWQHPIVPPSDFAPAIPPELDALILDLLRLDAAARPASAAEVMERLSGIGGLPADEQLLVAQAYLTTPSLVGRDRQLARVQKAARAARRGRGSTLFVTGPSGVGRSRFLDAGALAGRVLGLCVLRAYADDQGDYGVARALGRQLLLSEPGSAIEAARPVAGVLGHLLPELLEDVDGVSPRQFDTSQERRSQLQQALGEWLFAAAQRKPLLIVIDDFHRVDEPSAALMALLSARLGDHPVVLLVSATQGIAPTEPGAMRMLTDNAKAIVLRALEAAATHGLLASVFGDVPHLELLSDRLHGLSGGNPSDIMQLAQHLLERDAVRYRGGGWSLPEQIDPRDLPSNMSEAMRARVCGLGQGALRLARCFAQCPDQRFGFDDCLLLCQHENTGRLQRELDELVERGVLKAGGDGFALTQQAWSDVLLEADSSQRDLHLRLAGMFERRGNEVFRAARHRMRAGEEETALRMLIDHAEGSQKITDESPQQYLEYVKALPEDWFETYTEAVTLCDRLGRPPREKYALQSRLAGMIAVMNIRDTRHLPVLLEQLARLSGLTDWAELDPDLAPMPRLVQALQRAQERFDATPERERVMDPASAIRELARTVLKVGGTIAAAFDLPYLASLPSLGPLVPLSPAIEVMDTVVRGMRARMTGHRDALALYKQALERMSQPDQGGLGGSHLKLLRLGVHSGVGLLEASMGLGSCMEHAAVCAQDPFNQVNGLKIESLHHLWQGDSLAAERAQREVERLRIQNAAHRFLEGTHLAWQIVVHTLSDDLTRIKQTLRDIEPLAERYPGWRPVRDLGLAELHRVRGDSRRARAVLHAALSATAAGEHQIWPSLAGAHVRCLLMQGDLEEACAAGRACVAAAERAELGILVNYVRMPLAEALALLGRGAEAVTMADAAIAALEALGTTGLNLGLAYEARARVALALRDLPAMGRYTELCRQVYCAHDNSALLAKYERLKWDANRARSIAVSLQSMADEAVDTGTQLSDRDLASQLDTCEGRDDRARVTLMQLVARSGAKRGVLYALGDGGLVRAVALGVQPQAALDAVAQEFFRAELADNTMTCQAPAPRTDALLGASGTADPSAPGSYRPVLLRHAVAEGLAITGLAMLWVEAGADFEYPTDLATLMSERLARAGDVIARVVA